MEIRFIQVKDPTWVVDEVEGVQNIRLDNIEKRLETHDEMIAKLSDGFFQLGISQSSMLRAQTITNQLLKEGFKVMKIGLAIIASIYGVGLVP